MANQPRADNPGRVVRIEDKLWSAAQALADERGVSVSQVVRDALSWYVDECLSYPPPESSAQARSRPG